jgi:hypothetical protein
MKSINLAEKLSRAKRARPVLRDFPLPGRPWWSPEHSLWAIQHQKGRSFFQLLEYGLENDVLETIEYGRAAFDLHTENCALPGSQEEIRRDPSDRTLNLCGKARLLEGGQVVALL